MERHKNTSINANENVLHMNVKHDALVRQSLEKLKEKLCFVFIFKGEKIY